MNYRIAIVSLVGVLASPAMAFAQYELPSPYDFISNLDLECYRATPVPEPAPYVYLRHLNPVLSGLTQTATVHELERVCLPVEKNDETPPPEVLPFAQWVDLACFRAEGDSLDVTLNVSHLNPELAGLPDETVVVKELEQLCLPVAKAVVQGQPGNIPYEVRRLVEHVDVACYRLEEPTQDVNFFLKLDHLNPLIQPLNLEERSVYMRRARQICLPVGKNGQQIPQDVLDVVKYVDFLRYELTPPPHVNLPLWLRHMNPLYSWIPWFYTELYSPPAPLLMVPIAKNTTTGSGWPPN